MARRPDRHPKALLLVSLYALAESRIAGILKDALGSVLNLRELRRERLRIEVELQKVNGKTPSLVRAAIRSAFALGSGAADQKIGGKGRKLSALDTKAATLLADNLIAGLDGATTVIGRQADDVLRREGLRASLRQVETEGVPGAQADAMTRALQREGITGFIDKAGRRWKLSTYTEMAVRTTTAQAQAEGVKAKMLERGFDLVEVSSHGCSHHPSDPANACVRLEGDTFSLTGLSSDYEHLPELPPFHPNCTHFILPSVKAFDAPPEPALVAA